MEDRLCAVKCGLEEHWLRLVEFLQLHGECWVSPRVGKCTAFERKFVVQGPPRKARVIPLTEDKRVEMRRQIEALLERGVIVPSNSPWAAAAFFVPKKTGDWRMVMDYRPVNRQMVNDCYPLPLLWQTVQRFAGKRFYSSLDLAAGFWNCPIAEESRQYTSFICEMGQFEYTVLPFGIKNSPTEMQRTADKVFGDLIAVGDVNVYMDDIGIATNDIEKHFEVLETVFVLCIENGLWIQLPKCQFLQDSLVFLGFRVSLEGVRPDIKRVEALLKIASPKSKNELRTAYGALGYLRRFVPDFGSKTAVLTDMLSKKSKFEWTLK